MDSEAVYALAQSFATLTFGSALWHGSYTHLGHAADNRLIDVTAYLAHQVTIQNLGGDTILRELSSEPRRASGVEQTKELVEFMSTQPPSEWEDWINNQLDMPNYYITFSALVTTMLTYILPDSWVDSIEAELMNIFPITEDVKDFLINHYVPEIRGVTADVKLGILEKIGLGLKVFGVLAKLLFSFLWQEWVINLPFFREPWVNVIGAYVMPYFNSFVNSITGYHHSDANLQENYDVYPGDFWCRKQQPHAKWHEESANGLLDLVFLADDLYALTV